MANSISTRKFKVFTAKNLRDSLTRVQTDSDRVVGYIFIGKNLPYANESSPSSIIDTEETNAQIWDNMIAAKKVSAGGVEMVVPKYIWTANTRYKQYDDKVEIDFLLSETTEASSVKVYPMYVMNSEGNVYKCICNNTSRLSKVEPTGDYTQNQGFIYTNDEGSANGYLWKYMYNVRESNKFLSDGWMPAPSVTTNTASFIEYNWQNENLVDGGLSKIVVVNSGSGYDHPKVNVATFSNGSTFLTITDPIILTSSNVKQNMKVIGTGITPGTYITSVSPTNTKIYLSSATSGPGGGTGNVISVLTRVVILGDGTETTSSVNLEGDKVKKIVIDSIGSGYTQANVVIYGSGTGVSARAVLPPKYGHGYNPAFELGANNLMIVQRIGEVDSTEQGIIPTDIAFRQYGLLIDPVKNGENETILNSNANSVISMTTKVNLLLGAQYQQNEFVYQGNPDNPNFSGYVVTQTTLDVYLNGTHGTMIPGQLLIGANSATIRAVVSSTPPDFEKYAGEILYTKNIESVGRNDGQAEELKLVFQF